jgi:hypothetical protein
METFTLYGFGGGMIRGWVTLGLAAMVLIGCQGPSRSASGAASADKPNDTPEKLAEAYVLAVQPHDVARLRALFHPRVLACRNDANAAYFDFLLSHELSDVPRAGYKITTPSLKDDPPPRILPEGMFILPVAPTAQFYIDWNISEYASTTSIRELAPEGGRWYIVFPCPNAEGIKFFEGQLARGKEQQKRAAALAAAIKPALRTELVDLLNRGRKIDAVKKYRAATGADLTTAVQVMNTLQSSTQAQTK